MLCGEEITLTDRLALGFFRLPLPQAHSGATAVFINEFDTRGLKSAANYSMNYSRSFTNWKKY